MTDELVQLDRRVSEVISSAWSDNTLAVRNSQWKRYFLFCHDFGLLSLPASVSTVARFLVHLGQDVRFGTVNNYMSAIIALHRFYGYEIDFRSYYLIRLVLKGLKNLDVEGTRAKIPFTLSQLHSMYVLHVITDFDDICWLAVIICVRTLLRKSNVLPSSVNDPHVITRSDVCFYPGLVVFTIRSSKTKHKGDEPLKIPVKQVSNEKFCVYTRLKSHFERFPGSPEGPLILKPSKNGLQHLMYTDVLRFLKSGAERIGLDPSRVGLHSLRRTGAMHLYNIGIPLNDIRLIGDWRSLAVLVYLSAPFTRLLQVEDMSVAALNNVY